MAENGVSRGEGQEGDSHPTSTHLRFRGTSPAKILKFVMLKFFCFFFDLTMTFQSSAQFRSCGFSSKFDTGVVHRAVLVPDYYWKGLS